MFHECHEKRSCIKYEYCYRKNVVSFVWWHARILTKHYENRRKIAKWRQNVSNVEERIVSGGSHFLICNQCQWMQGKALHYKWIITYYLTSCMGPKKQVFFCQESTLINWNYQILGLHPVTACQKLGVILIIKWF